MLVFLTATVIMAVTVVVVVLVAMVAAGLVVVAVAGLVAVAVAGLVAGLVVVAGLVRVAGLAAHDSRMTRKARCSISTPASRARLRTARSCVSKAGAGG
jgi:hypothetical protein